MVRQVCCNGDRFMAIEPSGADRSPCFRQPRSKQKLLACEPDSATNRKRPPIESHKPVSQQYEEEYYRYCGWPSYSMGEGIWGMNAFPIVPPPPSPLPSEVTGASDNARNVNDPQLRSTHAVTGY